MRIVTTEIEDLVSGIIIHQRRRMEVKEPLSMDLYTTRENVNKSTIEINAQFVFMQLLIDRLLQIKYVKEDKQELITYFKNQYENNKFELPRLEEFDRSYSPDNALWWYTRDSFFYRTLNVALRERNLYVIYLYRSCISDIRRQLQQYQSKDRLLVYRGQSLSSDELDQLKQNVGQLISMNSFLSTTLKESMARLYLADTTQEDNSEKILFAIDADPAVVTTKPFADICTLSNFRSESEVLFMLGSLFRLDSITCSDDRLWTIGMTVCHAETEQIQVS